MSAPAANTSSEPAITMQRTSGSASNASTASASASMTSGESAFRASGRLSLHSATWSVTLVSGGAQGAASPQAEIGRFAASQVAEGRRPATCDLPPATHPGTSALIPVASRPMISFWICEVPS